MIRTTLSLSSVPVLLCAAGIAIGVPSPVSGDRVAPTRREREKFAPLDVPGDIHKCPGEDEALLRFVTGKEKSLLSTLTTTARHEYILPGSSELQRQSAEALAALEADSDEWPRLSLALYQTLLGRVGSDVQSREVWRIETDRELFPVPFAALAVTGGRTPGYLMERHEIRRVLTGKAGAGETEGRPGNLFVGAGDGVYNAADPRWQPRLFRWLMPEPDGELPRLPGAGMELEACSRSAGLDTLLLTGMNASESALRAAIARRPAIVHLSSHVVRDRDEAALLLGIDADGRRNLIGSESIGSLRLPGSIVAMSGCGSASGGLMQAWLAAGARVVVGTRWTVKDDAGEFFRAFYLHLSRDPRPEIAAPLAIREAKLDMLRSGTWRSRPRYWATFMAVEKE